MFCAVVWEALPPALSRQQILASSSLSGNCLFDLLLELLLEAETAWFLGDWVGAGVGLRHFPCQA